MLLALSSDAPSLCSLWDGGQSQGPYFHSPPTRGIFRSQNFSQYVCQFFLLWRWTKLNFPDIFLLAVHKAHRPREESEPRDAEDTPSPTPTARGKS